MPFYKLLCELRRKQILFFGITWVAAVSISFPAYAYIDAGTGSMLINGLVAGATASLALVKLYWFQIKTFLRKNPPFDPKNLKDMSNPEELPKEFQKIVFFGEDPNSYQYFRPIITYLTNELEQNICYLCAHDTDPVLKMKNDRLLAFFVGSGANLEVTFRNLDASVMVLTTPDLQTYHLKKSRYSVHYVYVFHNVVSTHMTFTETAFDNFDTIFTVGQFQIDEIRKTETLRGLPSKNLFKHGFGRLDEIMASVKPNCQTSDKINVVVAPTWGRNALLETYGIVLIKTLLNADYQVTVRPHPITRSKSPHILEEIQELFGENKNFALLGQFSMLEELESANILISDWSGVAMEFAFGLEKPVVFVDIPKKILNPNFENIDVTPLEARIRHELGAVIAPDSLSDLPLMITSLLKDLEGTRVKIRQCRSRTVFNIGDSGRVGAEKILSIAEN